MFSYSFLSGPLRYLLIATLTNPSDSAGVCTDATAPQARNSFFFPSYKCQNRLNFIDNGLLFLFNKRYFTFLVSISLQTRPVVYDAAAPQARNFAF